LSSEIFNGLPRPAHEGAEGGKQIPFKWYNWNTVVTSMSQTNPRLFGTVSNMTDFNDSVEGGPPSMNLSFRVNF
jgi:hypothetical protein